MPKHISPSMPTWMAAEITTTPIETTDVAPSEGIVMVTIVSKTGMATFAEQQVAAAFLEQAGTTPYGH